MSLQDKSMWIGTDIQPLISPYILDLFEKEVGYRFEPEYIIDQGYMSNTMKLPSKEYFDFIDFRREVTKLAKEIIGYST